MSWNWESEALELGINLRNSSFFNIGYEISDKICDKGYGNRTAIIWRSKSGDEKKLTYKFLAQESSRFAGFLKSLGILKGDRVFTYSDRTPEHYISILGILKAGGLICPLFSSFGQDAIKERLGTAGASAIIVHKQLLSNVLDVCDSLTELKAIVIIGETENEDTLASLSAGASLSAFDEYKNFPDDFPCEITSPEDPAIIHFTSGTTGKPKGAVHTHSALLGHYATTKHVLDLKQDDIYWCTADTAWVTGMSYGVFGPLSNASTQVSVEGNLTPRIIFDTIEKYNITLLYTAPTLLKMLMREKDETIKSFDLSSLRHIASVGEALNPEIIKWSTDKLKIPVYDTWFQTETGCIIIANTKISEIKQGSMGKPIPPVTAEILDKQLNPVPPGSSGHLALKPGWPSMFKTYWNSPEAYSSKFKNGWYLTGDNAKKDSDGYFWFIGRDDDVINTAGHLISPFEVESSIMSHQTVLEVAVISLPDPYIAEKIKAFVVVKDGVECSGRLKLDIRSHVRKLLTPYAVPQEIEFVDSLPKTRSGKILRRMLKAKELNMPEGDV